MGLAERCLSPPPNSFSFRLIHRQVCQLNSPFPDLSLPSPVFCFFVSWRLPLISFEECCHVRMRAAISITSGKCLELTEEQENKKKKEKMGNEMKTRKNNSRFKQQLFLVTKEEEKLNKKKMSEIVFYKW
ncbi:hypothetical protein OUZ56_007538 [Daphnia magna]|uniref:Uncharacterized protein n=1 Tax=Daphnia magna TaxID=35525 RepID=A0ABR0AAA0_9CRUS|nr:hypothetical protein OUZ56_007538 [Daphnia magna]